MIDKSKSILSSLNPRCSLSSLGLDETRIANLLNGFKSLMYIYLSMIPTLTFRLWVICSDVKLSRVYIKHKHTH